MFSFSFIRVFTRNIFALFVVFCLSAALFIGCSDGGGGNIGDELDSTLIGTWEDAGLYGTDGYTITSEELSYFDEYGFDYEGTIEYVSNFTTTAGVIIIKYTKVGEGLDSDTVGKYIGVYYQELNPATSVKMGTASLYPEDANETTLNAAIAAFTVDTEGTYMSYYGTYLWK